MIPPDVSPPEIASSTPADGATSVDVAGDVTVVFNEPVDPASVSVSLFDAGGGVPGSTTFDAATATATFTPNALLTPATSYSVDVLATDLVGIATPSPLTFSFTTATGAAVVALWDDTAQPSVPASSDANAVELGVKFTADVAGSVIGIRFFKGPANTATSSRP